MILNDVSEIPSLNSLNIGQLIRLPGSTKVVCTCEVNGKKLIDVPPQIVNGVKIDITKSHPMNIRGKIDAIKQTLTPIQEEVEEVEE